jgi:hypothetical protein
LALLEPTAARLMEFGVAELLRDTTKAWRGADMVKGILL